MLDEISVANAKKLGQVASDQGASEDELARRLDRWGEAHGLTRPDMRRWRAVAFGSYAASERQAAARGERTWTPHQGPRIVL